MNNGTWYKIKYSAFARLLGFTPDDHRNIEKIHSENVMEIENMEFMYYMDREYKLGKIIGLRPFYAYLSRMFRKTIAPKDVDANNILSYSRNLLARMKENTKFDVVNFI